MRPGLAFIDLETVVGDGQRIVSNGNIGSAQTDVPWGIVVLPDSGDVIWSSSLYVLQRLSWSSNTVSTIAGKNGQYGDIDGGPGVSILNRPTDFCLSNSGEVIFFSDWGNKKVKQLSVSDHVVKTVAGNGNCGFTDGNASTEVTFGCDPGFPGGLRGLFQLGDALFIADDWNKAIRRLKLSEGLVDTFLHLDFQPNSLVYAQLTGTMSYWFITSLRVHAAGTATCELEWKPSTLGAHARQMVLQQRHEKTGP
ncbi:hypothetical protein DUNSADRAFT_6026 [Dunaliella salina]|uniref:Uncharacterized protein n=1 Tax=Dunaliella salina TaxID=3046 RepID=A0ABQ7FTZ2_DUNSA|nr:hypothetical protein DUNSADRAFT_6026 [Dunaliella salina]|eukprot:KAF5825905.1 hypothetical protein DUNSADRAFT_6026 [Dunaliella salina]